MKSTDKTYFFSNQAGIDKMYNFAQEYDGMDELNAWFAGDENATRLINKYASRLSLGEHMSQLFLIFLWERVATEHNYVLDIDFHLGKSVLVARVKKYGYNARALENLDFLK